MDCFRDWFRTLLSLSGVCVGIFSIVSVFTLVDSLKAAVKDGFEEFGTNLVFIEREPIEPDLNEDGVFRWWEYLSRPPVTYSEYQYVRRNCKLSEKTAFTSKLSGLTAVDGDWRLSVQSPVVKGRAFSQEELERGSSVALLGDNAAKELFKNGQDPVGRSIRLMGKNFTVIGIFEKCGASTVSTLDIDNLRLVPFKSVQSLAGISGVQNTITAAPAVSAGQEEFTDELRTLVRQHRRLSPRDKDNFAINRISFVIDQMSEVFALADTLGWIIGVFSLLAGAFGIANIMFVSVQERTREIGIQKALGARRSVILRQFLTESALLSILGGAAGVVLVWAATLFIPSSTISVTLIPANAALGITISLVTGIAAGLAPAVRASGLDPARAISAR